MRYPHRPLTLSDRRYRELHARYLRYKRRYPAGKPTYCGDRHTWM